MQNRKNKNIVVAPLNWGLGHATRCIPIIKALQKYNFEPIIASDGVALELLKKEFPKLRAVELPSYNITYAKKASGFKLKIIKDSPHLLKTINKERKFIKQFLENENIDGIISDNRFGIRHKSVPSVFITHQLRVLSGFTTWLSSKLHQKIIKKFDECWIPDLSGDKNLSGDLGHVNHLETTLKYLGPLSRFKKQDFAIEYNLMMLLSGPEPQRTFLEEKLLRTLENYSGDVLFVKGKIEAKQQKNSKKNITVYNFMTSQALERAINQSDIILSRSGYTTLMDLAKLEKKAFFIPTPGQFEQEYLAKKMDAEGIAPYASQDKFSIEMLAKVENYKGLKSLNADATDYKALFGLF